MKTRRFFFLLFLMTVLSTRIGLSGITVDRAISGNNLPSDTFTMELGTRFLPEDWEAFDRYMGYIASYVEAPLDTLLEKTAVFFLGSPYVAHTLEVTDDEILVINLREFDCVTYIETVLALTNTVRSGKNGFGDFACQLQRLRYHDGDIKGYASRLHYTSDWVYDHEKNGLLENISDQLGGAREEKKIHFMSSHRNAYKQLKTSDSLWQAIHVVEESINDRGGFSYLPKEKIAAVAPHVPHMTMVGFTTRVEGLDTTHTGFAFRQGDRLTFIHASSARGEVVIDRQTLHDYCAGQTSCTGIIVARVL